MIETFFLSIAISFLVNLTLFLPAALFKTDKFTDAAYSTTFLACIVYALYNGGNLNTANIIITTIIALWALRLEAFLVYRIHKIKKDRRFDDKRNNPLKFAKFWLGQAIIASLIIMPAMYFVSTNKLPQTTLLQTTGITAAIAGLIIESVADQQKLTHILSKKKSFIKTGLWSISRHPNYFGEILFWIGMWISLSNTSGVQVILNSISPIAITVTLVYLTGLPLLEASADKKYKNNREYQRYKKKTPILIPFTK